MKNKHLFIIVILITCIASLSCGNKDTANDTDVDYFSGLENLNNDASYAMGITIGADLLNYMFSNGIIPYMDDFIKGMTDVLKGKDMGIDIYEAYDLFDSSVNSIMNEQVEYFRQQEIAFLSENIKKPGVITTSSGFQYEIINEGTGPKPAATSRVSIDYEGSLIDGTVFDSSYERGYPLEIGVNEVIEGWTEGLQLMGTGSHYIFYVPSELGYGPNGYGSIPPYSTLIFKVELRGIIN